MVGVFPEVYGGVLGLLVSEEKDVGDFLDLRLRDFIGDFVMWGVKVGRGNVFLRYVIWYWMGR